LRVSATGCFALSGAASPGASIGSLRPGRSSTSAPVTARSSTPSPQSAERPWAWSAARRARTCARIVFWHSLEHLRHAGTALDRAAQLLAPGGILVVAIPNLDSLQARAFGERWFALDLPRHLVHVPARALIERLRELGLEPARVSYLRGGQVVFGWLHGIVGSLPGHPDLYDAIRRPEARRGPIPVRERAATLVAGALALPISTACALLEASLRRGGTVYVEARRG
jgi:hypothetical protein